MKSLKVWPKFKSKEVLQTDQVKRSENNTTLLTRETVQNTKTHTVVVLLRRQLRLHIVKVVTAQCKNSSAAELFKPNHTSLLPLNSLNFPINRSLFVLNIVVNQKTQ